MKLVIVESPTKAKTINKYLGKDFKVKSSFGHVRDLPVKPGKKSSLEETMGIFPSNDWKAVYEILPGKSKIITDLKGAAAKADEIYLAADPDREGEAIAWHLSEILGRHDVKFKRVVYQEITKKAVEAAFANPGVINLDLVNAYKARRFLDRVVGFQLSPFLWKTIARGLSAGRVQSVALRMVVEREKEIKAFIPEEFWTIAANLSKNTSESITAEVVKFKGAKFAVNNENEAKSCEAYLSKSEYKVAEKIDKPTKSKPNPPFVTSTLQQAASRVLGFGVKRTMYLAQRLYENGYITYMRTDSTRLSDDAVKSIKDFITDNYGNNYLPETTRIYASKELAQEAHEAIRPSDIYNQHDLKNIDKDAKKLYDLIWKRTVSSQMSDAEFDTSSVTIYAGDYELKAKGRVLKFDGWQKVFGDYKNTDMAEIPMVKIGEILNLTKLAVEQKFTKPPPRYTEATLVKELEKEGIGRPSTYAQIISTIEDRGYVKIKDRKFYAEKIGEMVIQVLVKGFPELLDYKFTANLEGELDEIASSKTNWQNVLNTFYKEFQHKLSQAQSEKEYILEPIELDIKCEKCNRNMFLYVGKNGLFLGCSGYKLSKDKQCSSTKNLTKIYENGFKTDEDEGNAEELLKKRRCPICKTAMDKWFLDENTRLHICGNSPFCKGIEIEKGIFSIASTYSGPEVICDKCGKTMIRKEGRFGPYFSCIGAPDCTNTRKILRSGEVAPPKAAPIKLNDVKCGKCGAEMLLRDGARGIFIACSKFPKCRGTENVKVETLINHKSELDDKLKILSKGPIKCSTCKEDAIVRFGVKNKKYYFACSDKKCKWVQSID